MSEPSGRRPRRAGAMFVIAALAAAAYAAGYGPAQRFRYHPPAGTPEPVRTAVAAVYRPVEVVAQRGPKPVADAIDRYFYLWVPPTR